MTFFKDTIIDKKDLLNDWKKIKANRISCSKSVKDIESDLVRIRIELKNKKIKERRIEENRSKIEK